MDQPSLEEWLCQSEPGQLLREVSPKDLIHYLGLKHLQKSIRPHEAIQQLGAEELLRLLGLERLIRQVGLERVIAEVSVRRIIDEVGVTSILAHLMPEQRKELKSRLR
jgi:hypothetical protein